MAIKERTTTWSKLGTAAESQNLDKLLEDSKLNYNVVTKDLFTEVEGSKIQVFGKKATMRDDTNQILGIVSDRYQVCQNRDALDFVKYIDNVELLRAGILNEGSYAYLISQLPETKILGDSIRPHLIFQTSHDGSVSVKATICMLRIVCQNQFISSFKDSPATVSITHSGNMEEKVKVAQSTMLQVGEYMKNFEEMAESLAVKKITSDTFNRILEEFFVTNPDRSDNHNAKIEDKRSQFIAAYEAEDNQNFKGTCWGLVNAYSDFITHDEPLRKTENWETSKFYRSLSSNPMDKFLNFVTA